MKSWYSYSSNQSLTLSGNRQTSGSAGSQISLLPFLFQSPVTLFFDQHDMQVVLLCFFIKWTSSFTLDDQDLSLSEQILHSRFKILAVKNVTSRVLTSVFFLFICPCNLVLIPDSTYFFSRSTLLFLVYTRSHPKRQLLLQKQMSRPASNP